MPAELAIRTLRARTPAGAQPVAARLALQALGADLEDALPHGLPPQALLWLRRLALQAPEAALLRPAQPAWRQDWIAAGRRRFDAALAQAARPALGPVPESAPAVLFADAAEMLACLALAARAGQLDRWWWRGLLGRAWPQWTAAWAARPEAQAGAVRLLSRQGQAGLVAPWMAAPAMPMPPETPDVAERAAPDADGLLGPAGPAGAGKLAASGHAGEAPSGLGEAPDAVNSSAASGAAAATRGAGPSPVPQRREVGRANAPHQPEPVARDLPPAAPDRAGHVQAAEGPEPLAERPVAAAAPLAWPVARRPAEPLPRVEGAERVAVPCARRAERPPASAAEAWPDAPVSERPRAPRVRRAAAEGPASHAPEQQDRHVASPAAAMPAAPSAQSAPPAALGEEAISAWPWPQALATRQAPLLFIVNALLEDGLYPDFTRPRDPGLPVPLWALLAALASAWRLAPGDPLQAALAERCLGSTAPAALPAAPGAAAGPWAPWLAAYARSLRRRLCRRLGWRTSAWPRMFTLAQPARLWLSEAEWVAEFDLAAHDVAWRLAGLDRDPGWLPSAGCTLRFRFV